MGDYDDLFGKIIPRSFAPEFVVLSYVGTAQVNYSNL
jgi:hypothetical protein